MARTRECQYCHCLVDEACWCDCAEDQRDMREFDAAHRARRLATPKPATVEPPTWPRCTLEQLNAQYPEPAFKCGNCGLASPPGHLCPSQVLLDAWRDAPDGSRLFEFSPGAYSLHTPIKPVEAPTVEPPEWIVPAPLSPLAQAMFDVMAQAQLDVRKITGIADFERQPQPSPLDRALEAFIERRKAKRELNAMVPGKSEPPVKTVYRCKACGRITETYERCPCENTGGRSISRAMQEPVTFTARMGGR